ncbi:MAG: 6-hydroxymethylpterin diphosphokinase MptE-like protein [Sulfolobales archaeon]
MTGSALFYNTLRAYLVYQLILSNLTNVDLDREWDASETACLLAKTLDVENPLNIIRRLSTLLRDERSIIIGAGPSLEEEGVSRIVSFEYRSIFCADGACRVLSREMCSKDLMCVYVGDLDGGLESLLRILEYGGYGFIHFHGDNYQSISSNIYHLRPYRDKIVFTIQTIPVCDRVMIVPGFTDGDRAYMIAKILGTRVYSTIGMDLESEFTSRYSKPYLLQKTPLSISKREKLRWAKRVLDYLYYDLIHEF